MLFDGFRLICQRHLLLGGLNESAFARHYWSASIFWMKTLPPTVAGNAFRRQLSMPFASTEQYELNRTLASITGG